MAICVVVWDVKSSNAMKLRLRLGCNAKRCEITFVRGKERNWGLFIQIDCLVQSGSDEPSI